MKTIAQVTINVGLLILSFLINACSVNHAADSQGEAKSFKSTAKQDAAFTALTTLQLNTDEKNRLYSTFPNIDHPCYPPDTSFIISQDDFLSAMNQFVTDHCKRLPIEKRKALATAAAFAQKTYTVKYCLNYGDSLVVNNRVPYAGTWVVPNICERTDLTLVWSY